MPLPWRKAKIGRFSGFVANLQSSKRGGSLVVQTGFPTSLIDLILKNRDRLKKPSKKKLPPVEIAVDDSPPPPPPPLTSSNSTSLVVSAPLRESGTGKEIYPLVAEKSEKDVPVVSVPNRAFVLVVKLFLMLILALGTKKLTIAITVSAFVLLFLEFSGKSLFSLLKPCTNAQESLKSVVGRVLLFDQSEKEELMGDDEIPVAEGLIGLEETSVTDTFDLTEDNPALIEEIQIIEPDFELLNWERRWEFAELDQKRSMLGKDEDLVEDAILRSQQKTSSAKIKAKLFKKFVPKKFRGPNSRRKSKQQQPDSGSGVASNCLGEEEKVTRRKEQEQQEEDEHGEQEKEEEEESKKEEDEQGEQEEEESKEEEDELHSSIVVSQVDSDKNVGRTTTKTSSVHLIPFAITLAGLVGGRIMALVLTLSWCLLVKSVATARRDLKMTQIKPTLQETFCI